MSQGVFDGELFAGAVSRSKYLAALSGQGAEAAEVPTLRARVRELELELAAAADLAMANKQRYLDAEAALAVTRQQLAVAQQVSEGLAARLSAESFKLQNMANMRLMWRADRDSYDSISIAAGISVAQQRSGGPNELENTISLFGSPTISTEKAVGVASGLAQWEPQSSGVNTEIRRVLVVTLGELVRNSQAATLMFAYTNGNKVRTRVDLTFASPAVADSYLYDGDVRSGNPGQTQWTALGTSKVWQLGEF